MGDLILNLPGKPVALFLQHPDTPGHRLEDWPEHFLLEVMDGLEV